jgi:hypothetical protein
MAAEQTILFVAMPRGIAVDADPLPVSVLVTPRLRGADRLADYDDWRHWTERLSDDGLTLTLRSGERRADVEIDRAPLEPRLWEALFDDETPVRSHVFDDYSDRAVLSYSMRLALSTLKSIYQDAAVRLALPDPPRPVPGRDERGNRGVLRDLLEGLAVHWNPRTGQRWRRELRGSQGAAAFMGAAVASRGALDPEGLIPGRPDPARARAAALPFAVFHHMPTPKRDELRPDWDTLFDFHQAISALHAYRAMQRALGLVFDLEVPADLVPAAADIQAEPLSVADAAPGWRWAVRATVPELDTGCVHLRLEDRRAIFLAAPRRLSEPSPTEVVGLLDLDPGGFGLAQVDVDGAMHKAIMLAETWHEPDRDRNLEATAAPEPAPHPEVFDSEATLPALRSGGLSLYADGRAQHLLDAIAQSGAFNGALERGGRQPRPFSAEDLVRGYRLDVWDSRTGGWHSLHAGREHYRIGEEEYEAGAQEGFVQLAVTEPAGGADPATDDLYLHEAIARWTGWSLSAPPPGKALSRYTDPRRAVPPDGDPEFRTNEPMTPFKLETSFHVVARSLPQLRFGDRYRVRARAVDLAGNSLLVDEPIADQLAAAMALPRDPQGFPYLRYEPVTAPLIVLRDTAAATSPGSDLERLVIRTANGDPGEDADAADTTAADRHVVPPRTSVELGERLGMFDGPDGRMRGDPETWQLIADRDAGELPHVRLEVAGEPADRPLVPDDRIDSLPYLPDPLARAAALRDLPGSPAGTVGHVQAGAGAASPVSYAPLAEPNPRPGSATIIDFADAEDWRTTKGFRLALAEPPPGTEPPPAWDPVGRVLTVFLAKGRMTTVPLTSVVRAQDLPLMGQWRWLREHLDRVAADEPQRAELLRGGDADLLAHIVQRAIEGGHWLLTPPTLVTLVHAVQQPIGRPAFAAFGVQHDPGRGDWDTDPLQTEPSLGRRDPTELAPITAWRRPGATDAFLIGALRIHGASTDKVDLTAHWREPVDDAWAEHDAHVDELNLPVLEEGYLLGPGVDGPPRGWYDPEHDQIGFVRAGDWIGRAGRDFVDFENAAPRHVLGDTKHRRIAYTAVATSRYREYFHPDQIGGFTRSSEPVMVVVPASARPLAPDVAFVIPTFGWQREARTNLKRSVRFGGGLRVYLRRPWFSSGEGELLGAALYSAENGPLDRNRFGPFITQWGMDPVWQSGGLSGVPSVQDFPDADANEWSVSLDETAAAAGGRPGVVDVVGFAPFFDPERELWFADLTINTPSETYMPFVRLALVRYQPSALADAKVSRVVLGDFAQLTPDRTATVTGDPHHPRRIAVAVSGVAPRGPAPQRGGRPTEIRVRVQEREDGARSDLTWRDVGADTATVAAISDGSVAAQPDLALWAGAVEFARDPEPDRFRLLIEEHEHVHTRTARRFVGQESRLIYAETVALDTALFRDG